MKIHPARAALERWSADYPGIWRIVDEKREQWRTMMMKPTSRCDDAHIFLPLGVAAAAITTWRRENGLPDLRNEKYRFAEISELKNYASWRTSQGIYRFDPMIYEALKTTSLKGDIPVDLFRRLPEWSVYIETPGMEAKTLKGKTLPMWGVWVTLEHANDEDLDVLHLGLHTPEGAGVNHFPLRGTVEESLALLESNWYDAYARRDVAEGPPPGYMDHARVLFPPLISLILYLCSEEPEIGDGKRRPERPKEKQTKQGLRVFPADKPVIWDVGVRMGAEMRRGAESEQRDSTGESAGIGRPKRPHVRKFHWHTFLVGRGRQERRVKWLPLIKVKHRDPEVLPATIRTVTTEEKKND